VVILDTYCNYQACNKCPFYQNGDQLLSNFISGEMCFLRGGGPWDITDYILLCDWIGANWIFFMGEVTSERAKLKYKCAFYLLKKWKTEHKELDYFQYENYLDYEKSKIMDELLIIIFDDKWKG